MNVDLDALADDVQRFWTTLQTFLRRSSYATYSFHKHDVRPIRAIEAVMYEHGLGTMKVSDFDGIRREIALRLQARTGFAEGFFASVYARYDLGLETAAQVQERIDARKAPSEGSGFTAGVGRASKPWRD